MERRLAAILAADVVGYTRLMGKDEVGTLRRLTKLRQQVLEPLITEHRGRIVKLMGDGLLVEFASVVDALNCAVAWQSVPEVQETETDENKEFEFRIGINVGDVMVEAGDIHGDGVNIAARLESLAEPGGIYLSDDAYRQVRGKIEAELEDLGEHKVKNVTEPLRVYRVTGETAKKLGPDRRFETSIGIDYAVPDYPSIAVLPFTVMSAESEQEFFADGITEDIITALSKISNLLVVARNSTFTYKGKAVDVGQVGREQGVRYVLEGSVRKAGKRVRVTAQLIDTKTSHHLWADHFNRDLEDIFAVQDEIVREIVAALDVRLWAGEQARLWSSGTKSVGAWECVRIAAHRNLVTAEHRVEAKRLFEKALDLDPEYAVAWVMLGWVYFVEADVAVGIRTTRDHTAALDYALECGKKAVVLDPTCNDAYAQIAMCHLAAKAFEEAITMSEKAVALAPSNAENLATAALIMIKSGEPGRGLEFIRKAMRFCPIFRSHFLDRLAMAYRLTGQPDAAISTYRESIKREPDFLGPRVNFTSTLGELDRIAEAQQAAVEVLRLEPNFSIAAYMAGLSYRKASDLTRIKEGLEVAGLPG